MTKTGIDKRLLSIGISILAFFIFGSREHFFINNGLGWDARLRKLRSNVVLVGYFQSYAVGSAGKNAVKTLLDKIEIPQERYQNSNFILIHVRLTDYLSSNSLSHLDDDFYESALRELQKGNSRKYRIFTDGTISELMANFRFADTLRVVDTASLNSWQVLKLMTYFKGFAIANSSFSWWAASLKLEQSAKVVAPIRWFAENSPKGIHDPEWILF